MDRDLPINNRRNKFIFVILSVILMIIIIYFMTPAKVIINSGSKGKVIDSSWQKKILSQGVLIPRNNQVVISEVNGVVVEVNSSSGDLLPKGAVLLKLQNRSLLNELSLKKIEIEDSEQKLQTSLEEYEIKEIVWQGEKQIAEARMQTTRIELKANKELHEKGIISKLTLESIMSKLKEEEIRFDLIKKRLDSEKRLFTILVKSQHKSIEKLNVQLEELQFKVNSLLVKSPIAGVVLDLSETIGTKILAGDILASVSNIMDLKAVLKVPQGEIQELSKEEKVILKTNYGMLEGVVEKISPSIENGTVKVEVNLPDELPKWVRPNLTVRGEFQVIKGKSKIIPLKLPPNQFVFLYKKIEGTKAILTSVQVGDSGDFGSILLGNIRIGDEYLYLPELLVSDTPPQTIEIDG